MAAGSSRVASKVRAATDFHGTIEVRSKRLEDSFSSSVKCARMKRVCFLLKVKQTRLAEYKRRHKKVWPEMLAALRRTGWHNYSLFLREDGLLVGYLETPNFQKALKGMAAAEVNARWQKEMAPFFERLEGQRPDQALLTVAEVFHLD